MLRPYPCLHILYHISSKKAWDSFAKKEKIFWLFFLFLSIRHILAEDAYNKSTDKTEKEL